MAWRTDEEFHDLFEKAVSKADELDLDPLSVPRKRNPPRRLTGTARNNTSGSNTWHSLTPLLYKWTTGTTRHSATSLPTRFLEIC